jgi:outer membrane protein assembly factor BamB
MGELLINKKLALTITFVFLLISPVFATLTYAQTSTTSGSSNLNQYEWSQFQGDSSYTRFSAGPAPDEPNVIWKADIPGIQPYIAAFNGKIYVANISCVFALDQDGKIVWQTPLPQNTTWPIAYKIDSSHMVVESYCLNPQTGQILWKSPDFNAFTGIFSSNVYSPEEKMFYTMVNSTLVGWDFSDPSQPPKVAWSTYIRGGGITGIGTAYGDGKVFTGSFENMQYALDAKTGEIIWETPTKGPMIFTGAYADGMYFKGGSDDNTMYCFNASNGDIIWRYRPDTDGYFTTGCAVGYGLVYEMNKDGFLYAFDMYTGEVVWKYKGPDDTLMWPGMPSVADGKIYVTTGEAAQYNAPTGISEFSCLNARTGQKIWSIDMEALPPRESVAIAYGALYIIPGDVTTAVDTISGNEYATVNQIWAFKSNPANNAPKTISSWPQWRTDAAHSSTAEVGPNNLTVAWRFTTNGAVSSSASIANGVLYIGSQDKNIYALNAYDGTLIWKFATDAPVESSVAVVNGRVYTGGDDGYVYCLNAASGVQLWKTFVNGNLPFTFGNLILKSSPAVTNGTVYVGSLDGNLYALNAETGSIKWTVKAEGPVESSPATDGSAVYFTAEEPNAGALYKVDAASGEVEWKKEIPYRYSFGGGTEMLGSPSVAEGRVFASSNWGDYFCYNTTSGEMLWHFQNPTATEFIVSSPIYLSDGTVLLIDKFNLACVYVSNGWTKWTYYTGDELYVSPSYADGKAYMVTSQRHIFILDTTNEGVKMANATLPSSTWSSPTIANGMLYIGCNDWNVYCFKEDITTPTLSLNSHPTSTPTPRVDNTPEAVNFALIIIAVVGAILILAYTIAKKIKK